MMQFTYLLINFFAVIICFIFSFHPKIKFNRFFRAFILSSLFVAVFFIVWDMIFTAKKVWWFSHEYTIGLLIYNLPIEEILFFICIPFSCVFTYFCLDKFFDFSWVKKIENVLLHIITFVLLALATYFYEQLYTLTAFVTCALSILVLKYILKADWLGKAVIIYIILSPGFLVVNGLLTGTGLPSPVVNYNPAEFMGFRILTIPVEDFFYGLEMILWNLFFFLKFKKYEQNKYILV
ncbi:lycopene cyclase domain-containing protein [Chryseobacterium foetidum]|uniref:lycopene cyclase domain-containing protein n=1 Tax=Chryseobacterium foetidum TaxID=2951057 RepID=UPI0021C847F5|nr:lycopene cyclase domain-containing protein [Chryseobacterium foetidum]